MNGTCDVARCERPALLAWRPLTERIGQQVCNVHWNRYKAGTFDLYDAFGFERPPILKKRIVKLKDYCSCGKERQPGRKYCTACIAERKRRQKRESYHRKKSKSARVEERKILICRSEGCEKERELNHRYCPECAEWRGRKSHQKRQQNYYRRKQLVRNS